MVCHVVLLASLVRWESGMGNGESLKRGWILELSDSRFPILDSRRAAVRLPYCIDLAFSNASSMPPTM